MVIRQGPQESNHWLSQIAQTLWQLTEQNEEMTEALEDLTEEVEKIRNVIESPRGPTRGGNPHGH